MTKNVEKNVLQILPKNGIKKLNKKKEYKLYE